MVTKNEGMPEIGTSTVSREGIGTRPLLNRWSQSVWLDEVGHPRRLSGIRIAALLS